MTELVVIPAHLGTLDPNGVPVIGWLVEPDVISGGVEVSPILLPADFTVGPLKAVMPMKVTVEDKNAITGVDLTALDILRTDKCYRSKSFWHFKDESGLEFLFTIESGKEIPNDHRVVKINREAFFERRRSLPVVDTALLFNGVEIAPPEADAAPDDEDDYDLI
jgi:hypothetical protein